MRNDLRAGCGRTRIRERGVCHVDVLIQRRIERAEEEDLVSESRDVTTKLGRQIVVRARERVVGSSLQVTELIVPLSSRIPGTRTSVRTKCAVVAVGTGLGDHLNNAALGFAVLRSKAVGLDVNFFNEGEVDACTQR